MGNHKLTKGFISCEEAGNICDRSQYKEASLWQRMKLELHIFWCEKCNAYVKRNNTLSKMLNKYSDEHCKHHLSEAKKSELETIIEQNK